MVDQEAPATKGCWGLSVFARPGRNRTDLDRVLRVEISTGDCSRGAGERLSPACCRVRAALGADDGSSCKEQAPGNGAVLGAARRARRAKPAHRRGIRAAL